MADDQTLNLSLTFNEKTQRIEIAVLADEKPGDVAGVLGKFFHVLSPGNGDDLGGADVQTSKTDPKAGDAGQIVRPMWTLTTCDIIK